MRTSQFESGDSRMKGFQQDAAQVERVEQVLNDVYELLEHYGPLWYEEPLRERIQSVLGQAHD